MGKPAGNHSIDKQKKADYLRSRDLHQTKMVKLSGTGDEGRAVYGMEPWKAVLNIEPPDADPHVRWCERRAAAPPSYSIVYIWRVCLKNGYRKTSP